MYRDLPQWLLPGVVLDDFESMFEHRRILVGGQQGVLNGLEGVWIEVGVVSLAVGKCIAWIVYVQLGVRRVMAGSGFKWRYPLKEFAIDTENGFPSRIAWYRVDSFVLFRQHRREGERPIILP